MTDDGRRMPSDGKSSPCQRQGELMIKKNISGLSDTFIVSVKVYLNGDINNLGTPVQFS